MEPLKTHYASRCEMGVLCVCRFVLKTMGEKMVAVNGSQPPRAVGKIV